MSWLILIIAGLCETGFAFCLGKTKYWKSATRAKAWVVDFCMRLQTKTIFQNNKSNTNAVAFASNTNSYHIKKPDMQKHCQKSISIVSFVALMLCLVLIMMCCHRGFNANKNTFHYSDIERIRIGMPLDSVILVLGQPYAFSTNLGCHDLTCKNPRVVSDIEMTKGTDIVHCIDSIYQDTNYCCEANRENMMNIKKHTTLTFTKPMNILNSYPMLWVHLDSEYRVREVYAKYYGSGLDEKCIYSLSPSISFSDSDSIDNHTNLFMDTTLFRKCFPN